jgi:hypothetical protein
MEFPLCLVVKEVGVISGWLAFCFTCLVENLSWSLLADLKIKFFNSGE